MKREGGVRWRKNRDTEGESDRVISNRGKPERMSTLGEFERVAEEE